jgi:hypothetical protein
LLTKGKPGFTFVNADDIDGSPASAFSNFGDALPTFRFDKAGLEN